MKKDQKNVLFDRNKRIWLLFIVYLLCLVVFAAFKFRGSIHAMLDERAYIQWQRSMGISNFVFAPFETITFALNYIGDRSYQLDLLGSVICYLPLGIFVPLLLPARYKLSMTAGVVFISSLIIILSIEVIQYLSMFGVFNFDDIILGIIGVLLGFAIYMIGKSVAKAASVSNT